MRENQIMQLGSLGSSPVVLRAVCDPGNQTQVPSGEVCAPAHCVFSRPDLLVTVSC